MRICLLYLWFFVGKYFGVFSENSEAADGEVSMRIDSVGTGCNGFLHLSVFRHLKSMKPFPMAIEINQIATLSADS